jgi:hypothetical protein
MTTAGHPRWALVPVLAFLGACAVPRPQEPLPAGEPVSTGAPSPGDKVIEGTFQGTIGYRRSDEDLGQVGRGQAAFDVVGEIRPAGWWLGLELGFAFAVGTSENESVFIDYLESFAIEGYLGPRVTVETLDGLWLYAAGGGTLLDVEAEVSPSPFTVWSDSSSTFAPYVRVGAQVDITDEIYLVGDGRWVLATDIELFGQPVDADYWQVTAGMGVHF